MCGFLEIPAVWCGQQTYRRSAMTAKTRIQAKARTQFDINTVELDVIEEALRYQAHSLSMKTLDEQQDSEPSKQERFKARMNEIQTVLGKLHNQKVWFVPKESVPLG